MSTLTNEQLTEKYKRFAEQGGPLYNVFTVQDVMDGNYKVDGMRGHPFTIGSKHVAEAADHYGGILGREVCEKIPCEHQDRRYGPKCGRPLSSHTSDRILLVNLCRDLENKEATDALLAIKGELEKDGISGVGFACRFKKFKIAEPKVEVENKVDKSE